MEASTEVSEEEVDFQEEAAMEGTKRIESRKVDKKRANSDLTTEDISEEATEETIDHIKEDTMIKNLKKKRNLDSTEEEADIKIVFQTKY